MNELAIRYEQLVLENGRLLKEIKQLKAANADLEKHAAIHCVGCTFLGKHKYCDVFWVCMHPHSPGMIVDPFKDFCSRRRPGGKKFPPPRKETKK